MAFNTKYFNIHLEHINCDIIQLTFYLLLFLILRKRFTKCFINDTIPHKFHISKTP